jgi:hypothetical protein
MILSYSGGGGGISRFKGKVKNRYFGGTMLILQNEKFIRWDDSVNI